MEKRVCRYFRNKQKKKNKVIQIYFVVFKRKSITAALRNNDGIAGFVGSIKRELHIVSIIDNALLILIWIVHQTRTTGICFTIYGVFYLDTARYIMYSSVYERRYRARDKWRRCLGTRGGETDYILIDEHARLL